MAPKGNIKKFKENYVSIKLRFKKRKKPYNQ